MRETDPFLKPFLEVKVRDLRPWLSHYRGQYGYLFTNWLQQSYCKGTQSTGFAPFLLIIGLGVSLGYFRAGKKAQVDGIFVGSGTAFEPKHEH